MNRGLEYYNLAVQYVKNDNLNQAICYFKMAIDFGHFEAAYDLALLYCDEEKYDLSIEPSLIAIKHGFADAETVLIKAYEKTGQFKKCLNLYFKRKRFNVDIDVGLIIKTYVKKTIAEEDFIHLDIYEEMDSFAFWKNSPIITNDLRTVVLKQRSILFNEYLKQNLPTLKTAEDYDWFASLLKDYQVICRVDDNIVDAFNKSRALFETKGKDLETILETNKDNPYYSLIEEQAYLSSINKILSQATITRSDSVKLKGHIDKLNYQNANQCINHVLKRIYEEIKKEKYDAALDLSYAVENLSKREEILRLIEKTKIENRIARLKKSPSNNYRSKRELADLYMHSTYAPLRDTAKGLNLLEDCFLNDKSQSALLELLVFYRCNGYRDYVFYLIEKARSLGVSLPDGYERIYRDKQSITSKSVTDKQLIKNELNKRGIRYLLHFTSLSNLPSIKKYGLLSRIQLEKLGIAYKKVDPKRIDNQLGRISLSITNHNEFYLKKALEDKLITKPILLRIDAAILADPDVFATFYVTNAANKAMSKLAGSGINEFNNMFENILTVETSKEIRTYNRLIEGRRDNQPTDLQAEVMIDSVVPLKYIKFMYDFDKKNWEPIS